MARDGGTVELIQLWVNLPAQRTMMQPAYQELRTDAIPSVQCAGGAVTLHVVSGELHGVRGPAITQSTVITAMGTMQAGGRGVVDVPPVPTVVLYVLSGRVRVNHTHVVEGQRLVVFGTTGTGFHVDVEESGSMLLLAGVPLNEPMVQYGPFVMNSQTEIMEAMRDYQMGKMGFYID
jgi:redox-sensitive bicupin YhaK (pirin superfamily)